MTNLLIFINICILFYFVFSFIVYTILFIFAFPEIIAHYRRSKFSNAYSFINKKHLPPVTIFITAYKSNSTIINAIRSALNSIYPNLYIIVIADGDSGDNTIKTTIEAFQLEPIDLLVENNIETAPVTQGYLSKTHPNLMLVQKEHAGPGDALNVGLNICFTPYIMTMDADSLMEPDTISEMVYYMMSRKHMIAAGGGVYISNNNNITEGKIIEPKFPRNWIAALQVNEYMRSHLFNRTAWNHFGGTMCYSGTATLFSRQALLDVNGFDTKNFTQDAEVIMRLHEYFRRFKKEYTIGFTPTATVWTEVPETIRTYSRQQNHWRRGLLRSTLRYWYMFLNPRYKIQGLVGYPLYLILEILAPYVEFTAYFTVGISYFLGILDAYAALLFILLAWGAASILNLANAFINLITFNRYRRLNDVFRSLGFTLLDIVGFRQYVVVVKVWASLQYLIYRALGKAQ